MNKDFDEWNKMKKGIDSSENKPIFYEREIWNCNLGLNVSSEQDGVGDNFIRPILIFRKFNKSVFWAIPLTRTIKKLPFYHTFQSKTDNQKSTAILSQIRLLDSKRLLNKINYIELCDFEELNKKFKELLP